MFNTTKTTNAIRCTNCNAPIEIIGNQKRCKLLACGYCGTVMDYKNDLRALYAFTEVEEPNSRLRIGMKANIEDVGFTISAYVVYETLQGEEAEWVEYHLYAPNYGYALIVIRGDSCCFLRKTYYLPKPNMWLLNSGDSFVAKQREYSIDDFYLTMVLHSEGLLLENIKQNKRDKHCFASVGEQCYYSKYNLDKVIYYQGVYMQKAQLEALFT